MVDVDCLYSCGANISMPSSMYMINWLKITTAGALAFMIMCTQCHCRAVHALQVSCLEQ